MKRIFLIFGLTALLTLLWYGLSPLFMNKKLNESLPGTPRVSSSEEGSLPKIPTDESREIKQAVVAPEISQPVPIIDTVAHPASGVVRIVHTNEETIVRYEDYKTINGPDVRVYLANDLKAKDFVDLGPIKGTEGNINYPVPPGVNIKNYRYVLTWCEDFSVLFNSADLSTLQLK